MCATTFRSSHTRYAMAVSRIISTTPTLTTVRSRKVCVSESLSMNRLAQQREGQRCPSLGAARNWRTCLIFAWAGRRGTPFPVKRSENRADGFLRFLNRIESPTVLADGSRGEEGIARGENKVGPLELGRHSFGPGGEGAAHEQARKCDRVTWHPGDDLSQHVVGRAVGQRLA